MARQFRTPSREKSWSATSLVGRDTQGSNETSGLVAMTISESVTIVRIRGYFQWFITAATAAGDEAILTFAIGIVSSDAFTALALPDPQADTAYPWLWWHQERLTSPFAIDGTGSDDSVGLVSNYVPVDSRAMRKMKQGQELAFVAQYSDVTGAPAIAVMCGARVLLFE